MRALRQHTDGEHRSRSGHRRDPRVPRPCRPARYGCLPSRRTSGAGRLMIRCARSTGGLAGSRAEAERPHEDTVALAEPPEIKAHGIVLTSMVLPMPNSSSSTEGGKFVKPCVDGKGVTPLGGDATG